jgi:nucleoside-diphosphate-sugar epimerase
VKTVLITGASGFLGSHFLDWFMRSPDDYDLWPMDIKPHPLGIPYDLMDMGLWLEDFDIDCDLVIHMAAPVGGREKIEGDPLYNADSLRLDSLLFRWAIKHAKTVVFPSSSAVYGVSLQGAHAIALNEGMFNAQNPTWPAPDEMYGFTKLAGERLAWSAAKYGLNTLCIRPFSGYGEGQSFEYPIPSIARRALHREDPIEVWGSGEQRRDFVYVNDLIEATMARLERPVEGYETMNIGSGYGTSFNEVARICAEIVDYEPKIANLVDKPVGVQNRFADTARMYRYYEPKTRLREGLERVIAFIRAGEEASAEDDPGQ